MRFCSGVHSSLYYEFFPLGTVYPQALDRICSVDFSINKDDVILSLKYQGEGSLYCISVPWTYIFILQYIPKPLTPLHWERNGSR